MGLENWCKWIGGYHTENYKSVIILHPDTEDFDQSLPPLKFERVGFGCATFSSPMHDNRVVVLAVGGYKQATAEVLDYTQHNPSWTESMYRFWQILHWFLIAH